MDLVSDHEEADSKIFVFASYLLNTLNLQGLVISSPDTDVAVLSCYHFYISLVFGTLDVHRCENQHHVYTNSQRHLELQPVDSFRLVTALQEVMLPTVFLAYVRNLLLRC